MGIEMNAGRGRFLAVSLLCVSAVALLGCETTLPARDTGSADTGTDASEDAAEDTSEDASADAAEDAADDANGEDTGGAMEGRGDFCGNGVDDDQDGEIDELCGCAEDAPPEPCWTGNPSARGIGACTDGMRTCTAGDEFRTWSDCEDETRPSRERLYNEIDDDCDGLTDEGDAVCVPMGAEVCSTAIDEDCDTLIGCDDPECLGTAGCPMECQPTEVLCFGGNDDDCDGAIDCDDAECFGDDACISGPCGEGSTPTYRQRVYPPFRGASRVIDGDGQPVQPMECEEMRCPPGQVAVQSVPGGPLACVPPPSDCPPGQHPTYQGRGWRCDPPCDKLVQYGHLFDYEQSCAPPPPATPCPSGQVQTFVYETQRWECRRTCNNGLYDRRRVDGINVCIPC